MHTLLRQLRVSLILAGVLAVLLVPAVSADSDHERDMESDWQNSSLNLASTLVSGTSVTVSGPGISGTPNAVLCTTRPGSFAAPLGGSNWISSQADCTSLSAGDFTYTTTFALPSSLAGLQNLRLDGSVLVDDSVTINLNGNQIFSGGTWTGAASFGTSSFFQGGTNTLQFVVHNVVGASALDFTANVTANGSILASGFTPVTVSGSGISGTQNALTCTNTPGWGTPLAGSQWLSSHSDCTVTVDTADFTYTTTFTLPSNLSGLALNGSFLVDDSATVQLNGHQLFNGGNFGGSSTSVSTFSATDATFFNQGGANTLVFTVRNNGGASGLDFVASVTANGQPVVNVGTGHHGEGDEDDDGGAHGACVSAVAHSAPHGRAHGEAVSQAAHTCPR